MALAEKQRTASTPASQSTGDEEASPLYELSAPTDKARSSYGSTVAVIAIGLATAVAVTALVLSGATAPFISNDKALAILASIATITSSVVAVITSRTSRHVAILEEQISKLKERNRLSIQLDIFRAETEINEGFLKSNLDFPVFAGFPVKAENRREANERAVLLLHQLTLLHRVFLFQETLGKKAFNSYIRWAKLTLKPWINQSEYSIHVLMRFIEGKENVDTEFIAWLRDIFDLDRDHMP